MVKQVHRLDYQEITKQNIVKTVKRIITPRAQIPPVAPFKFYNVIESGVLSLFFNFYFAIVITNLPLARPSSRYLRASGTLLNG